MPWFLARFRLLLGYDRYSAETIDRLCHSRHVKDLRLIVNLATVILLLLALGAWTMSGFSPPRTSGQSDAPAADGSIWKLKDLLVPIGAALASLGGIVAWCYKTGNTRLGTIDLFSCEITTLCRICVVNGLADNCINTFRQVANNAPEHSQFSRFDSVETYTPIFDGNAKELRELNVKALINATAFYTYWKATRDAFRKLATLSTKEELEADVNRKRWRDGMRNVVYMQFLAAESARKAVGDLIEYEPNRSENEITILLNELPAYRFLLEEFRDDVRHERLALRLSRYHEIVPKIIERVEREYKVYESVERAKAEFPNRVGLDHLCRDWAKAHRMLTDLNSRYTSAVVEVPPDLIARQAAPSAST